jgi:D-alanyl-D-alanine carboxypeptidase/Putative peptidoglycan binding domain
MTLPVLPRRPRSEYVDVPTRIARRTSAGSRGWFAGWPDKCPPASARVRLAITRPSDGRVFNLTIDARLADLFGLWSRMQMDLGHELRGALEESANGSKQGGMGSFVCRAIKGSNPPAPSNHSTATAWDLFTRSNPQLGRSMDRQVPFVSTIHPEVVELAAAADIYWGGWYWDTTRHRYVDAMHFEYMRRPSDVADSTKRLRDKYAEIEARHKPTPIPPGPDPTPPEEPVTPDEIKALQLALNAVGTHPPLTVDGVYGDLTDAAVKALPQTVSDQVDTAEATAKAETKQAAVDAVNGI